MNSAGDVVDALRTCGRVTEFLERDLKSRSEVGFSIGEHGTVYEFREGSWDELTFWFPPEMDERRVVVHTHPSIDSGPTLSASDQAIGETEGICGLIVLSQEMFEVEWVGKAMHFGDSGETATTSFRVVCDGSTDGPARDRWVENPRFE